MKATELHVAIMNKEDFTLEEADELIGEMKALVDEGEMPDDVLFEFGYDMDYVFDLLDWH
jgi:hypothetical protein